MTQFFKDGNVYTPAPNNTEIVDRIELGTYMVKFIDPLQQYRLERINNFAITEKIYGNNQKYCHRIISTFNDRLGATGVLMVGEKGSGKSLLAKLVSIEAHNQGIITIVVNEPYCGDLFNQFMQRIEQPAVVIFDEFEKVYDNEDQQKLLTLLDGTFSSKRLYLLTSNDKWQIDRHMRNRPGRIYYMIEFEGVSPEFVKQYCQDNLKNQKHIDQIIKVMNVFHEFNFDMLKGLVQEVNRYDICPVEALELLNIKPQDNDNFSIDIFINDRSVKGQQELRHNPLNKLPLELYYYDSKDNYKEIVLTENHIDTIDDNTITFIDNKLKVIFTKQKFKSWSFKDNKNLF